MREIVGQCLEELPRTSSFCCSASPRGLLRPQSAEQDCCLAVNEECGANISRPRTKSNVTSLCRNSRTLCLLSRLRNAIFNFVKPLVCLIEYTTAEEEEKYEGASPIWYLRLNEAVDLQSQVDSRVAITLVCLSNHLGKKYF